MFAEATLGTGLAAPLAISRGHPFAMLLDPVSSVTVHETSATLLALRSAVHRPLDKPCVPKCRAVAEYDAAIEAGRICYAPVLAPRQSHVAASARWPEAPDPEPDPASAEAVTAKALRDVAGLRWP